MGRNKYLEVVTGQRIIESKLIGCIKGFQKTCTFPLPTFLISRMSLGKIWEMVLLMWRGWIKEDSSSDWTWINIWGRVPIAVPETLSVDRSAWSRGGKSRRIRAVRSRGIQDGRLGRVQCITVRRSCKRFFFWPRRSRHPRIRVWLLIFYFLAWRQKTATQWLRTKKWDGWGKCRLTRGGPPPLRQSYQRPPCLNMRMMNFWEIRQELW